MSFDVTSANYALGMFNNFMQSTLKFSEESKDGNVNAFANYNTNIFNGIARNQIAYNMALNGNPSGQSTNAILGFATPDANTLATSSLFLQSMTDSRRMMNPFMMANGFGYFC